jgi:hypothetical protein
MALLKKLNDGSLVELSPADETNIRAAAARPDPSVFISNLNGLDVIMTDAEAAAFKADQASFVAQVPSVTALQARRALRAAGLYDKAKSAVDVGAQTNQDIADSWEYADVWHRDAPWVRTLGAQLGLTSDQIDALFRQASGL